MKLLFIILIITTIVVMPGNAGNKPFTDNKYVTVELHIKRSSLKAGSSGEILISLKPVAGIHINLQPAIELKLDSSSLVSLSGGLNIPKRSPYLNLTTPVKQRFLLAKHAKPGTVLLKGMLTYYYCSDKEGWCSKFKQPIEIALKVTR